MYLILLFCCCCCCFQESGNWRGIRYDSLTEEQRKQAKAEVEAAPKAYEDMMKMFQEAGKTYKETGKFIGTDLCIFSTPNNNVTLKILLSSFYFSKKEQSDHPDDIITTFPRYNGTIILMGAAVRGSYKFYQKSGWNLLPYHGATSGTGWSAVLIGMMLADDCTKAYDKLKTHGLTNTRLIEILESWDNGAPDSVEIKNFYEEHLQYQPLGIYRSDRDKEGYVMIGIAPNLQPLYRKRMKKEISTDYFEKNKVEVYAPELVSLMDISMGSPRIHIYPADTGAMGSHHDSSHNTYDDIRQQKYSILFDINDYKYK